MKVKILNTPTLKFVDSGIGMCWGKGGYGDTEKGFERIDRVCNKLRHSSMLRFATYIFRIEDCPVWIFQTFKASKYIEIEGNSKIFTMMCNAQSLKETEIHTAVIQELIPINHWFLFGIEEADVFYTYPHAPDYGVNKKGELVLLDSPDGVLEPTPVILKGRINSIGVRTDLIKLRNGNIINNAFKTRARIVAETFLKNPKNLAFIEHKDGNVLNDSLGNIEWVNQGSRLKIVTSNSVGGVQDIYEQYAQEGVQDIYGQYNQGGDLIKVWTNPDEIEEHFHNIGEAFSFKDFKSHLQGKLKTFKGYEWNKKGVLI